MVAILPPAFAAALIIWLVSFLAALALIYALIKLGNPLRPRKPATMPDPITVQNLDLALRHISETYGQHPHDDAHDEADGAAPVLLPVPRKRGRPRKTTAQEPGKKREITPEYYIPPLTEPAIPIAPKPACPKPPKPEPARVLAVNLRIPAQITYSRGHHAGEPREMIIMSIFGHHAAEGEFAVQTIKGICTKVKQFRAFRVDHIVELVDISTGEIISDIHAWLNKKLAALV